MDDEASRQLEALYRRAMEETRRVLSSRAGDAEAAAGLRKVWEAHRERLASFVGARLGGEPRDAVGAAYSPSLQLEVLGLPSEGLREPVLDVGCGRDAALVLHLRQRGVGHTGSTGPRRRA